MAKSKSLSVEDGVAPVSLFRKPVAYSPKPLRKTFIIVPFKKDDGISVPQLVCVEDKMKDVIALDYRDVTLSNLRDKGVEPHALDMVDTNRLGGDAGFDALANHIANNPGTFFESK